MYVESYVDSVVVANVDVDSEVTRCGFIDCDPGRKIRVANQIPRLLQGGR